jgi:hypothetical protein
MLRNSLISFFTFGVVNERDCLAENIIIYDFQDVQKGNISERRLGNVRWNKKDQYGKMLKRLFLGPNVASSLQNPVRYPVKEIT